MKIRHIMTPLDGLSVEKDREMKEAEKERWDYSLLLRHNGSVWMLSTAQCLFRCLLSQTAVHPENSLAFLCFPCNHSLPPSHTHSLSASYTHSTHTVHTQYTHSTHTLHTQYTTRTHTVHTQPVFFVHPGLPVSARSYFQTVIAEPAPCCAKIKMKTSLPTEADHQSVKSCLSPDSSVQWGAKVTFTFTFSHLADAFIQSDLQGCIQILSFTLMARCTSGAIRGSVSCSRTLRQGIEQSTLLITKRLLYHCTTVAP